MPPKLIIVVAVAIAAVLVAATARHDGRRMTAGDDVAVDGTSAPVENCAPSDADPLLVRDRGLEGAVAIGPLVLYPADGFPVRGRRVMGPKAVAITTEPVTVAVGRSARRRFSLLFAGATTGRAGIGFRVRDGIPAARFTTCGRPAMAFRGGFLYRGAQCVPIAVRPDTGPTRHAMLAIGRPPPSCH